MSRVMRLSGLRLAFSYFLVYFPISTDFTLIIITLHQCEAPRRKCNGKAKRAGEDIQTLCLQKPLSCKRVPACPRRAHSLYPLTSSLLQQWDPDRAFLTPDVCTCLGREGVECNPGKPGPSSDSETVRQCSLRPPQQIGTPRKRGSICRRSQPWDCDQNDGTIDKSQRGPRGHHPVPTLPCPPLLVRLPTEVSRLPEAFMLH